MYVTLFGFFLFAITISFLCSLWEAVLLSISPIFAQIKMQEGGFVGKSLQHFKDNIDKPLAAILTLNTFAHTIGAIGVGAQASLIWRDSNPIITGVIVPLVMTFAILILSEIIPKTIGANYWDKFYSFTIYSLSILVYVIYPLVWLCQLITQSFRKDKQKSIFTRTDFVTLTEIGEQGGIFDAAEADMIEKALELNEIRVTDAMRPSSEMITIKQNDSIQTLLNLIKKHKYSRYPVQSTDSDEIVGIIHAKDLLTTNIPINQGKLTDYVRPVFKVKKMMPVNDLLRRFREGMPHFALVYNRDNSLVGFITLDNVLQIILGIIKDEFHQTAIDYQTNKDGSITAKGSCSIYALEQAIDKDIEVEEYITSLNGLIMHHLEDFPKERQIIELEDFKIRIDKVQKNIVVQATIFPRKLEEQ